MSEIAAVAAEDRSLVPAAATRAASAKRSLRTLGIYGLLLLVALLAFLAIRVYGETLPALPGASVLAGGTLAHSDVLFRVLLALAAVLLTGAVLGRVCIAIGQPPVIGEVIAGILLGPSLIGPEISALILPPAIAPQLNIVAQIGVILYMFIIGLELNGGLLKERVHTAVTVSQASIVVPFVMGALLALYLYPRFATSGVPFTSFALFMGVAVSITAFPVLARILKDRGLEKTELGTLALGCAAANDVTAWCLLAVIIGIVQAQVGAGLKVIGSTLVYAAVMLALVRPLLRRLVKLWDSEPLPRAATAFVFLALAISALAAEAIGIHALFGAFMLGAVLPHDSVLARTFMRQLEPVVTVFLLPAFFAFTGMNTRFDQVSGYESWLSLGVILLVATVGKFGGTYVAARMSGLSKRDSGALGALMNTRGLVELIVLNVGLQLGVIPPPLFALMVAMAIITTVSTAPMLKLMGFGQKAAI
ncbi:MAG: cation/H(+) antiporter [Hydrocarboniphaga sp.]|uniref:cation:proton antiporter n=1 Tax=Hydrocarboniphaga sp. TaxID=2033016 RepID=UPI00262C09B7|nr:cation:proton antiporter [Hydrocarboniphaga sp.]MDB5971602.1 cation/H(+) antiporter [Hydrocarboniphaga sp.]